MREISIEDIWTVPFYQYIYEDPRNIYSFISSKKKNKREAFLIFKASHEAVSNEESGCSIYESIIQAKEIFR